MVRLMRTKVAVKRFPKTGYERLPATGVIAAGESQEFNITDFFNMCSITRITVTASASTDFDVEIYQKDVFDALNRIYRNVDNNIKMIDTFTRPLAYTDLDNSKELHMKIINTDAVNASYFELEIYYEW